MVASNKARREEQYAKRKQKKGQDKLKRRLQRKKDIQDGKEVTRQIPKTLENMHKLDETAVTTGDEQMALKFNDDEFSSYFKGKEPKIVITTNREPFLETKAFCQELAGVFHRAEYIKRNNENTLPAIMSELKEAGYTDLLFIQERANKPYTLTMCHLPDGPCALLKLSSIKTAAQIRGHGNPTSHPPELILANFGTQLGVTLGRFLAALCPPAPKFHGRQVLTFHNGRDFIFFRRHRYMFDTTEKVSLQELGPRFTLKLLALWRGSDISPAATEREFIWLRKKGMNTRKYFAL